MTGRTDRGESDPFKRLLFALVGAVALTAERADELAESLAERGGMSKEEVRTWIDEASSRWVALPPSSLNQRHSIAVGGARFLIERALKGKVGICFGS